MVVGLMGRSIVLVASTGQYLSIDWLRAQPVKNHLAVLAVVHPCGCWG
jgi:hypothetical protein